MFQIIEQKRVNDKIGTAFTYMPNDSHFAYALRVSKDADETWYYGVWSEDEQKYNVIERDKEESIYEMDGSKDINRQIQMIDWLKELLRHYDL